LDFRFWIFDWRDDELLVRISLFL